MSSEFLESYADFLPLLMLRNNAGPQLETHRYTLEDRRPIERFPTIYFEHYQKGLQRECMALEEGMDAYLRGLPLDFTPHKYAIPSRKIQGWWWRAGWRMGQDLYPNKRKTYLETLLESEEYKRDMTAYQMGPYGQTALKRTNGVYNVIR